MPPPPIKRKLITIAGKRLPPPPRKVVIERLPPLPPKPQGVIIERWLPYKQLKRRVILNIPKEKDPVITKPKNIIVQWERPEIEIKTECKHLGVIKANPDEYVSRYGSTLINSNNLPKFVHDIKPPKGILLAHDCKRNEHPELEGDLDALGLIDLDKEGLSQYKNAIFTKNFGQYSKKRQNINSVKETKKSHEADDEKRLKVNKYSNFNAKNKNLVSKASNTNNNNEKNCKIVFNNNYNRILSQSPKSNITNISNITRVSSIPSSTLKSDIYSQVFAFMNLKKDGKLTYNDILNILKKLNKTLGRNYNEEDAREFFSILDVNKDLTIDLDEFNKGFGFLQK
jgi:hypothetical protein